MSSMHGGNLFLNPHYPFLGFTAPVFRLCRPFPALHRPFPAPTAISSSHCPPVFKFSLYYFVSSPLPPIFSLYCLLSTPLPPFLAIFHFYHHFSSLPTTHFSLPFMAAFSVYVACCRSHITSLYVRTLILPS
jgi:hypothetical protein